MPLPLPKLDNRTFDQLVAEGRLQAPRLAPAWTDYNESDPGITQLELFSWLVEADIFRLDRTSLALLKTFLRRLGVEPAPALAAETILTWQTAGAAAALLPAGMQVGSSTTGQVFETTQPLAISPAVLAAILVVSEGQAAAQPLAGSFWPFGRQPQPGSALVLGFDRSLGDPGRPVRFICWGEAPAQDRLVRARLVEEWQAESDEAAAAPGPACPVPPWQRHYRAVTQWEYFSTAGVWQALPGVLDETRAFSLSGAVEFNLPGDLAQGGLPAGAPPLAGLWFIRCRLVSGGYECPPRLNAVAINATAARHAAAWPVEALLGASNGSAGQVFALPSTPAVPGSLALRVETTAGSEDWRELPDLEQAGPHARAYCLNTERSAVCFGNGRSGRVPPAGAKIWLRFAIGGGEAGNLPAGALDRPQPGLPNTTLLPGWDVLVSDLTVRQPFAALGGTEAEALPSAQGRALDLLARSQRAVTLADCAALALQAPGLPLAAARALANYYPKLPCVPASGCVTVVVTPACPERRPKPSPELLAAVARYVQRRVPLTTELHVIGPAFQEISVVAQLVVHSGISAAQVQRQALAALDQFLSPLRGGPDGTGWPVGRDVYRSEVMAILQGLPGVAYVMGMGLLGAGESDPRCGNFPICPDGLVTPGRHQIEIIDDVQRRGHPQLGRGLKGVCGDE